jgi:uncharacterized protein YndB with AHSA1/START domain
MENSKYDWTRFTLKVTIKANLSTLYNYWTKRTHIEKWFLEKAEFTKSNSQLREQSSPVEKDDVYSWKWHGSDIKAEGRILLANGKDLLQFTFFNCKVTVKISVMEGENMIELTQEGIPQDETSIVNLHLGCTRGWTFYLTSLKSILEGPIDLRNKNDKLRDVINT